MKPYFKKSILSLPLMSSAFFATHCHKQNAPINYDFFETKHFLLTTDDNQENHENIDNDNHFLNILVKYTALGATDIEHIEEDNHLQNRWGIYATVYINQKPHEISLYGNSLEEAEQKFNSFIFKNKTDEFLDLENEFKIQIQKITQNGIDKFIVYEINTQKKHTFKTIADIVAVYSATKNNSAFIAKNAKMLKYILRKIRGKDTKNQVIAFNAENSGKGFVIDGFDDLASALENSGLPKQLELTLKSSIYMVFGGAVWLGYEGAHEELQNSLAEYSETVTSIKQLRTELVTNLQNEISLQEQLLDHLNNTSEQKIDTELKTIRMSVENHKFKIKFIQEVLNIINNKKHHIKLNDELLKNLRTIVVEHNSTIEKILAHKKKSHSNHYHLLFDNMPEVELIKKMRDEDNKNFVLTHLNKLKKYQDQLAQGISNHITSQSILPNTSRGLVSMYYGMIAFETKAFAEIIVHNLYSTTLFNWEAYLSNIESIGNTFLSAGQAQMVLAGLSKIFENNKEIKGLKNWIESITQSHFWKEVQSSDLDNVSKIKILKTKKMIESFYRVKKNWLTAQAIGDIFLTSGQAQMFVSGPLFLGMPILSGFGAASTILGIIGAQGAEHFIEKNFEFPSTPENSIEAKICDSHNQNDDNFFENQIEKSLKLIDFSQQKTRVRIWQKIYDSILQNPNREPDEIIKALKKEWKQNKNILNSAKDIYHHEIYKHTLKNMFNKHSPNYNKNIKFVHYAKKIIGENNSTQDKKNSVNLSFISFVTTHLQMLNERVDNKFSEQNKVETPLHLETVLTQLLSNHTKTNNIKLIISFFDEFGLGEELDRRIVKKIISRNGYLLKQEKNNSEKIDIAQNYLKEIVIKTDKKPWNFPNPLPGFFIYYFPRFLNISNRSKPLIFSTKNQSIYIFDKLKYLEDLENFNNLELDKQNNVLEFTKLVFDINNFDSKADMPFFHKLHHIKHAFGRELRGVFQLTYEEAKKTFRANALRPIFNGITQQIDNYNTPQDLKINSDNQTLKKITNSLYQGVEKFSSAANKFNAGMNIFLTPQSINQIYHSITQNNTKEAIQNSSSFMLDKVDLLLDIGRNNGLQTYWIKHPKTFQGLGSLQFVINSAAAGMDIWRATELYQEAIKTEDPSLKQDLFVNSALTGATAATSLGTALLLPLSAKAGPIGTAIGFTIMATQGTYNAVRLSQQLRKLGFDEKIITLNSISHFFGHYQMNEDPKIIRKKMEKHFIEKTIPNLLEEKNNAFFSNHALNLKDSYYFKKIIFPSISLFIPFSDTATTTYCYYLCNTAKTQIPKPYEDKKHLCLTNNTFYAKQDQESDILQSKQLELIQNHHHKLVINHPLIPKPTNGTNYGGFGGMQVFNETTPCPQTNINSSMLVAHSQQHNKFNELAMSHSNIAENSANLYLVGIGDQGKHGNMISSIIGEQNSKNLYEIHPATYALQLIGGDNSDIIEFFEPLKGTDDKGKKIGFIDGGKGIDTISLKSVTNQDSKKLFQISLDPAIQFDTPFITTKNIENMIGSNFNDEIIGNEENNVLMGNEGDDSIKSGNGNDILHAGSGADYLEGGSGKDVYVILKKDIEDKKIKIINNYDANWSENDEESIDAILTDVERFVATQVGSDLILSVLDGETYRSAVKIINYFVSDNYKHLILTDLQPNKKEI